MHLISNRASVENEEISLLAIFETFLASLALFSLYWFHGQLWHIAWAACLAPFLLLRTPQSSEISLEMSSYIMGRLDRWSNPPLWRPDVGIILKILYLLRNWITGLLWGPGAAIVIIIIKIIVNAVSVIRYPRETISAIPSNWRKIVLPVDFFTIPEIIPGIESNINKYDDLSIYRVSTWIVVLTDRLQKDVSSVVITIPSVVIFFIFIYLPAILYRVSLKSTAILWSPLLLVVRPINNDEPIDVTLNRILVTTIARVSRSYSAIILLLILAKLGLFIEWVRLKTTCESSELLISLRPYIVPDDLPMWHVASFFNAVLTVIVIYGVAIYYRDEQRIRAKMPDIALKKTLNWLFFVRNLLSVYAIFCTLYVTVQVTSGWDWPPLGAKLLPY